MKYKNKSLTIGLDIGIASVGWAIVNENKEVIAKGVNLFTEASKDSNENRRNKRHLRRTLRRRKQRVKDYKNLVCQTFNISLKVLDKILFERNNINLLEKRKEATEKKIDNNDLYKVLLYYIIHRGYLHVEANQSDDKKDKKENKEQLEIKREATELVVTKQLDFYNKHGYYRGTDNLIYVDPNQEVFNNTKFSNVEYLYEVSRIFEQNPLPEKFISEYKKILTRKRDFSQGPGSPSSLKDNNYSMFVYDEQIKKFVKDKDNENLWDKLVGKCSIYPDQKRTYKSTISFELFNCLSELSNINVMNENFKDQRISIQDQKELVNSLLIKKTNKQNKEEWSKFMLSTSKIIKFLNKKYLVKLSSDDLKGYRIDKKGKEVFTEFKILRNVLNFFEINGYLKEDFDIFDLNTRNILDELCFICTQFNQDVLKRNNYLIDNFFSKPINKSIFKKIPNLKDLDTFNQSFGSSTGSLSIKAINDLIEKYINLKQTEFMANVISELKEVFSSNTNLDNLKKYKYFPLDDPSFLNTDFMPTAVIRSFRQALKILNEIFKEFGLESIKSIGIELARDYSSDDERKSIKELQKVNEESKKWLFDTYGIELKNQENKGTNTKNRSNALLKAMLFLEQGRKCIYTGKELAKDVKEILDNPHLYDIDHILPISQSFNDSRSNKVLTTREQNARKANRTPLSYLTGKEREDFINRVKNIYGETYDANNKLLSDIKYRKNKKDNLLYELDLTKFENQLGFVSRNLNDTRHVTSLVSSTIKEFFKIKEYDIGVYEINGKLTSLARKNILPEFSKNREESHDHHAMDAAIVAYLSSPHSKISSLILNSRLHKNHYSINKDTGEVKISNFQDEILGLSHPQFKNTLISSTTHLTFKQTPKTTKQISDETRYGLSLNTKDNQRYTVLKKNIYKEKVADLHSKFFSENPKIDQSRYLGILQTDYKKLKSIFDHYYEIDQKKNPFESHLKNLIESKDFQELKRFRKIKNFTWLDSSIESKQNMIIDKYTKKALWDTVKPVGVDIYLNDKNKLVAIPLNALTFKMHSRKIDKDFKKNKQADFFKLTPDQSKDYLKPDYFERIKQKNVDSNKFVRRLHLGNFLVEIDNTVYRVTSLTEKTSGGQVFDCYDISVPNSIKTEKNEKEKENQKKKELRKRKSLIDFSFSKIISTNILGTKVKKEDFVPQHLKSMLK